MAKKPKVVKVVAETLGYDVIEVVSESNPKRSYRVDVINGRCSCPAWIFQRGRIKQPCKHLRSLGFKQPTNLDDVDTVGLRRSPKTGMAWSPNRKVSKPIKQGEPVPAGWTVL